MQASHARNSDARPTLGTNNDYHILPATQKQLQFANHIAQRTRTTLPDGVKSDRRKLSRWIDEHKPRARQSRFSEYPSSKQVAFAERLARLRHHDVPHACFRDRTLMSKWIDSHK